MKSKPDEVSVGFEVTGDAQFTIKYISPLLQDHILDYPSLPEDECEGQMRRLLRGSVVGCFCGTIYFMITSLDATVKSLKETGTATTAKGDRTSSVVKAIDICVEIDIDEKDAELLEKVKKIVQRGCLISKSIAQSITVTHSISRIAS